VDERSLAYPSPAKLDEERGCFACYQGVVYIGHTVHVDGDEVEVLEAVPCRRCAATS
jgi:DsbC/DsbD-like thiol-disulfide interchange protein